MSGSLYLVNNRRKGDYMHEHTRLPVVKFEYKYFRKNNNLVLNDNKPYAFLLIYGCI